MKKFYLLSTIIALLFASCAKEVSSTKNAVVSGTVENCDNPYMMLVNMDRAEQDSIKINEDGTFKIEVDASEHHLFTLFYKQDILEIYLLPGETLEVVTDGTKFMESPLFKGTRAEEASVMNKKLTMTTAVAPQELLQMSPTQFQEKMKGVIDDVNKVINDANIDSDLKELLKADAFFTLLPLREGYSKRKKEEIAKVDTVAFYAYKSRIDKEILEENNLESTAFKMYLLNYLQNEIMERYQEDMREAGDRWIIVMMEKMPSILKNEEIRDYCYLLVYRNMMMGRMIQMPDEIVADVVSTYKKMVQNEEFEKDIDMEYEEYSKFKKEQAK